MYLIQTKLNKDLKVNQLGLGRLYESGFHLIFIIEFMSLGFNEVFCVPVVNYLTHNLTFFIGVGPAV